MRGGRARACFVGVLLILFRWGLLWLLGDSALFALAALLTLPLVACFVDGPAVVAPLSGAMLLAPLKRLEANRRPLPPPDPERLRVIPRRLFLDRDIASHADWIRRTPDEA